MSNLFSSPVSDGRSANYRLAQRAVTLPTAEADRCFQELYDDLDAELGWRIPPNKATQSSTGQRKSLCPGTTVTVNGGSSEEGVVRLPELLLKPVKHEGGYTLTDGTQWDPWVDSATVKPLTFRQFDTILGLCEAATKIQSSNRATTLLRRLSSYVPGISTQPFILSQNFYHLSPCPWHLITVNLVDALFQLGLRFSNLRHEVNHVLSKYLQKCQELATHISPAQKYSRTRTQLAGDAQQLHKVFAFTTSVLGFLEAAAVHAVFWTSEERHNVLSSLHSVVIDDFLVAAEATFSTIRNSDSKEGIWKSLILFQSTYDALEQPIGALAVKFAFMKVVERCAALMVLPNSTVAEHGTLPAIISLAPPEQASSPLNALLWENIANISIEQLADLEDGLDYIQLGSPWQQSSAQALKASCLTSYLCCVVVDEDAADPDLLLSWLEKVVADPQQNVNEDLACAALQCLARLARSSETIASNLSRSLPQMLIHRTLMDRVGKTAAKSLLYVLKLLSQDAVITTIWGLGNSLSGAVRENENVNGVMINGVSLDGDFSEPDRAVAPLESTTSLVEDGRTSSSHNCDLVIRAIVTVAKGFKDPKITALAISMLIQKVGKVTRAVDLAIITSSAELGPTSSLTEFKALLRFYNRLIQEGTSGGRDDILAAVRDALSYVAINLRSASSHHRYFTEYILRTLIAKGDTAPRTGTRTSEIKKVSAEMAVLVHPLSLLVAETASAPNVQEVERFASLQRDAWYNLVLHGFSLRSTIGRHCIEDLKILAHYSEPLVPADRENSVESPIELNMVLKRGSSDHGIDKHRQEMIELLPSCESELNHLDYSEMIFLKATHLVETLRALSGDCTKIMGYFVEPRLQGSNLGRCVRALALNTVENSIRQVIDVNQQSMTALSLAAQMSSVFQSCCHRSSRVQEIAYVCADRIIDQVPSVMCQKKSLFTLLDLMTLMWSSCLESETTEYEWESELTTPSGVTVVLSDDFAFRSYTLRTLYRRSKEWGMKALNNSSLDFRGLLQTYLSNHTEDESFGHIFLGRSFAIDMGSVIPQTDHRLNAINANEMPINTASDFIAQYTGRQEYRFTDPALVDNSDMQNAYQLYDRPSQVGEPDTISEGVRRQSSFRIHNALKDLEKRIESGEVIEFRTVREILRLTASLLCRLKEHEDKSVVRLFVKIPFDIFTKQVIKLGLSLWMGVLQENGSLDAAIVMEMVLNWKRTAQKGIGIFDNEYMREIHPDPFYIKMEYAPSDMDHIHKLQHRVHDRLAPHLLILQFMSSHYMAQRLNGSYMEFQSLLLLRSSLMQLENTPSHPLARELHFNIILFALKALRYSNNISPEEQRLFKDEILTAALAWFRNPSRFSFGGNRVQVKAETHLLADTANALQAVRNIGPENTTLADIRRKRQELLQHLLANEQTRLVVWLFPLDHRKRHFFASGQHNQTPSDATLLALLETAWQENPSLAINLSERFSSGVIKQGVRRYILQQPERAIHDPRAVRLMLGSSLPDDVKPQLQHLVKWAPVDPITAVTYLLPAYGNHPLIIQYAMSSLESHSVEDVTFFYVPQIVQSLRYDALGHIENYIIKTAGFSQLFAHQIIWNIKANSYKDEDATDPDPMKPKLDRVMDRLIASFGGSDKDFYEREFAFFNEVTGVSGKLRQYLKASKPEKKQKIEEELRKIRIDPGVYLPCNPDGVVVNIDRTSGKPLQSHAKTPYMATFRIRKERTIDPEDEAPISPTATKKPALQREPSKASTAGEVTSKSHNQTYEIWQSAIFKVGDDCRQDILALQMIACFRGIFAQVGLPVYVFPYRVTATAPGCGIVDVLPRTISRDMLGREAVNGLYPWFVSRFGSESSPAFQAARANFAKSLAAYSIISFLLQFKDRHNGNIMFDEDGHILHIDFGFCFDIAPGGVRFERAPFKLTKEMLSVLGGSTETQAFRWFEELCIKAFLASRAYVDQLSNVILCMLDSGLPCFKPETIRHFKERFVLEKDEREAAEFVRFLIKKSLDNKMTYVYDEFQLLTNGIPF